MHRGERRGELALASVDHDEVRHGCEGLVVVLRRHVGQPREAAGHDLGHRGEVVHPVLPSHAELAVVRLLRHSVLKDDHRAHVVLAHHRRDVEALDPERQRLEVQHLAQLLERLDPAQALQLRLV